MIIFALLCSAFIFSFCVFGIPCASAKTVSIPSVDIIVTILPDGSALVHENRTIVFDGDFTFGYYELPKKGFGSIQDVTLSEGEQFYRYDETSNKEPGTFTLTDTDNIFRIDFYFSASDETRTFTFRYTIKDVVSVYQDYGEFYWKLQGDGWDFGIGEFKAIIQWEEPIPMDNYYIWAHGPLWGEFLKTDETSSSLFVEFVPPNSFVEARVLLPSSYFTAPVKQMAILESVIEEETLLSDEANEQRLRDRKFELAGRRTKTIIIYLAIFFMLLYFSLFNRVGKEHLISNPPVYYREPPSDLKPAIVGMLKSFQNYQNRFLEGTILDLIRRKHIQYEETKDEYTGTTRTLARLKNKSDLLEEYEVLLLDEIVFDEDTTVTMKGLRKKFLTDDRKYYKRFQSFKKKIHEATQGFGFFDDKSKKYSSFAVKIGVTLCLVGFIGGIMISYTFLGYMDLMYMLLLPVGLFYIFGSYALQRRTRRGAEEYSKWKAFSSFMTDFTNLKEYGPKSVIIWERFIVYATVFGIASVVLKALKVVAPTLYDTNHGSLLGPAIIASSTGDGNSITSTIEGISAMSRSISWASTSSSSSGSGSGGGFSSGGGGGGGGSGGGFG